MKIPCPEQQGHTSVVFKQKKGGIKTIEKKIVTLEEQFQLKCKLGFSPHNEKIG